MIKILILCKQIFTKKKEILLCINSIAVACNYLETHELKEFYSNPVNRILFILFFCDYVGALEFCVRSKNFF